MSSLPESVFIVSIVLIVVTTLAIALRVWDRVGTGRNFGWDDGLIIFSWILSIGVCANIAAATKHGLGIHSSGVPSLVHHTFLKLQLATSVCYSTGITSAKASFAILYLRLFPVQHLVILNKGIVIFLLLQAIEETFITLFHCHPIAKAWTPELPGNCLNLKPLWYSTFAFNFATDIILFIEPIIVTWRLQMPLIRRIALNAMLSLGLFVTIISVVRLKYVITIGADDTYELAESLLWSAAEFCALIICSCIPSLRHIALKVPWLKSALELSPNRLGGSRSYFPQRSSSMSLRSRSRNRNRRDYVQSNKTIANRSNPFGSTNRITAVALGTLENNNDSEEGVFPHRADQSGAIVVTHDVIIRDIESRKENTESIISERA